MSEYLYELVAEVKRRMRDEGAVSEADFVTMVDNVIDEWLDYGKIHPDSDIESLKEQARQMRESKIDKEV